MFYSNLKVKHYSDHTHNHHRIFVMTVIMLTAVIDI